MNAKIIKAIQAKLDYICMWRGFLITHAFVTQPLISITTITTPVSCVRAMYQSDMMYIIDEGSGTRVSLYISYGDPQLMKKLSEFLPPLSVCEHVR